MSCDNVDQLVRNTDDLVGSFRDADYDYSMYEFPDEYTNWIREQNALQQSCTIVDQSYHMSPVYLEGPDAIELLSDLGTNNFENIRNDPPPIAKNVVFCNPDGYMIRDVVLFYVDEETFISTGTEIPTNWLIYNLEAGEYDASAEVPYRPGSGVDPREFRFQVQGPYAYEVMDDVVDGGLPEFSFFEVKELTINDVEVYALGFGMGEAPGLELFGAYEYHDEIEREIVDSGREYDIMQMGSKAYKTNKISSGWIHQPVPAIYTGDAMEPYRRWLDTDGPEGKMSIGGSYVAESIQEYYMDPIECGQGHLISFNHDFVGKSALERKVTRESRTRVTFEWDDEDVVNVYRSLFDDGPNYKYIDLPDTARRWSLTHYDRVERDGSVVGISKYPGYLSYENEMLSLGVIDEEYSEPGTEVALIWGEENSRKEKVEPHVEKEITAVVMPSPYTTADRDYKRS
ncbi:aminomethyl transferase family protein [Natronorarus salvus]|uniref:aminomethyl transferase family protein n=1 Tax=Natronorarus salvus TaxID=3117733 RepID=UPI002F26CC3A